MEKNEGKEKKIVLLLLYVYKLAQPVLKCGICLFHNKFELSVLVFDLSDMKK